VLGGTFDRLHVGHAALLAAAFAAGRRVSVGLTTDRFVRDAGKPGVRSIQGYAARRRALRGWLSAHFPRREWRVVPLADRFGRSVEPGVGVLVVSAETERGGRAVNDERRRRGLPSVPVVVVPLLLADDLAPVSSRRIRAGEIDRHGRRCAPLSVGLAVADRGDRVAAARGIREAIRPSKIRVARSKARVRGSAAAQARRLADRALPGRDLGVGVARRPRGGWVAVERSARVTLDPRNIAGGSPAQLTRGVRGLLRPDRPQPL
jgi:pantetheine-phosphate adenylyltransferase